jgi:hypothetical protein
VAAGFITAVTFQAAGNIFFSVIAPKPAVELQHSHKL